MRSLKKSTAWALVLCLVLSLALAVGPVAAEAESETVDPYVYYWSPDAEQYPEYYSLYARRYMMYCVHWVHALSQEEDDALPVQFFNVVNTAALIEDESQAPAGGYATTGAFCVDAETSLQYGAAYRRMNLEDAYFSLNADGSVETGPARHIRAIMRNSMPYVTDMSALEQKVNAYLTETYGEDAVLISGLTGPQLVASTQSALWHYSNGLDFSDPYPYHSTEDFENWSELTMDFIRLCTTYPDVPDSFLDAVTDTTATNISGVYQYLINLPGEDATDISITENALSVVDAAISGSGDESTLTLLVNIHGTINSNDDLTLTARCGDQTQTYDLGASNTLEQLDSGLYTLTFEGVSPEDCEAVELVLEGEQTVEDVCFFQAKPTEEDDARKASQNLTGFGHDAAPVYSRVTFNAVDNAAALEITKVDEKSGNPLEGVAFDLYRKLEGEDLLIGSFLTDENGKITLSVTDAEEYYFVETEALTGYEPINGKLEAGQIPNSWNAGSLEISKKLINATPAQVGETFNFKLTLDLSTAPVLDNGLAWMTEQYLMGQLDCSKALTWTVSGDQELTATFTVDADETVTVNSIPLGTTYTLEEVMTAEDRQWFTVTTQIDGAAAKSGNTASGTVAAQNAVLFTNSVVTGPALVTGAVEVSKKLVNTTPAVVGETFNFRITLDLSTADVYTDAAPWMNDDYLMGFVTGTEDLTWTEKDGKYTADFTVDADETFSICGIAQGTTYTVEEIMTEEDREWFTVTSKLGEDQEQNAAIVESVVAENNAILFTNSVVTGIELATGTVEATKKLTGAGTAKDHEQFTFRITLDLSAADIYQDPAPWMYDEYLLDRIESNQSLTWTKAGEKKYTATFTLKPNETITIDGIAQGTDYTLEEVLTKEERSLYQVSTTVTTDGAAAVEGKASLVNGSVSRETEVTFTNKSLEQIPTTDDLNLTVPLVLCLLSLLMGAVLMLSKRRFAG